MALCAQRCVRRERAAFDAWASLAECISITIE
jgi:hypothetical protein